MKKPEGRALPSAGRRSPGFKAVLEEVLDTARSLDYNAAAEKVRGILF
jgi:hypothetical protein